MNQSKIKIKPADQKETLKLLITWAKRNEMHNTFKTAIKMMQDFSFYNKCNQQRKTIEEVAETFFKSSNGKETEFINAMDNWKSFIRINGNKWK